MAIKTNHTINLFKVKTMTDMFQVKENTSVQKGDLLYFYTKNEITYVTNQITADEPANGIAIKSGNSLEEIPCYIF